MNNVQIILTHYSRIIFTKYHIGIICLSLYSLYTLYSIAIPYLIDDLCGQDQLTKTTLQ